jgi:hypothetical protein
MTGFNNYYYTIKKNLINQHNIFNCNKLPNNCLNVEIKSSFNSFGVEKNPKLVRLYNIIWYLTNQKPLLKRISFNYIKKKILKRIIFSIRLSKKNLINFINYMSGLYLHFFHIYYQKQVRFNVTNNNFSFYLDNPQLFFRNYIRKNQKIHLKISFILTDEKNLVFLSKYLSNLFLLKN